MEVLAPGEPLAPAHRPRRDPRRGEVLLRIRATSVNFHDYSGVHGRIANLPWPRIPFSDACAEVLDVGEDVTRVVMGDRVCPNFFPKWQGGRPSQDGLSVIYGDQVDGFLQEYVCVDAGSLVHAPRHLTDAEAATLPCAGLTAWRSLVVEAQVKPGATVVVQGTGGVSLFALGIAKMLGARVIATSSSEEKLVRAEELGADHVINYRRTPDWDQQVLALTNGRGADVVVDVGGSDTLPRAVMASAIDGHVSVIGVLSGVASAFPLRLAMAKNVTVRGITVGSRADLDAFCRALEATHYRPVIDSVFDRGAVNEALGLLVSQRHFGKIAIAAE